MNKIWHCLRHRPKIVLLLGISFLHQSLLQFASSFFFLPGLSRTSKLLLPLRFCRNVCPGRHLIFRVFPCGFHSMIHRIVAHLVEPVKGMKRGRDSFPSSWLSGNVPENKPEFCFFRDIHFLISLLQNAIFVAHVLFRNS